MNRYIIPLQIDTTKNVPYYKTDIVTPIPSEDIPYYYVTQEGDRLDTISSLFYLVFLLTTLSICSSTSLVDMRPRNMQAQVSCGVWVTEDKGQ